MRYTKYKDKLITMKPSTILLLIALTINGCMETPEISTSQESITRDKIIKNKTEAKKAQEEYLRLQRQRH